MMKEEAKYRKRVEREKKKKKKKYVTVMVDVYKTHTHRQRQLYRAGCIILGRLSLYTFGMRIV